MPRFDLGFLWISLVSDNRTFTVCAVWLYQFERTSDSIPFSSCWIPFLLGSFEWACQNIQILIVIISETSAPPVPHGPKAREDGGTGGVRINEHGTHSGIIRTTDLCECKLKLIYKKRQDNISKIKINTEFCLEIKQRVCEEETSRHVLSLSKILTCIIFNQSSDSIEVIQDWFPEHFPCNIRLETDRRDRLCTPMTVHNLTSPGYILNINERSLAAVTVIFAAISKAVWRVKSNRIGNSLWSCIAGQA